MALALAGQVFDFFSKLVVPKYQTRVQSLPYIGDNRCIEFATEQRPVGA
jgi:hypothetical protein